MSSNHRSPLAPLRRIAMVQMVCQVRRSSVEIARAQFTVAKDLLGDIPFADPEAEARASDPEQVVVDGD